MIRALLLGVALAPLLVIKMPSRSDPTYFRCNLDCSNLSQVALAIKFCGDYKARGWSVHVMRPEHVQFTGTEANECIVGNAGHNKIDGAGGDDIIFGLAGDDDIRGGGGADRVYGGCGNDIIDGGDGDDYAEGQDGNDLLIGGAGADELYGGDGDDAIYGKEGADRMSGGAGNGDRFPDFDMKDDLRRDD